MLKASQENIKYLELYEANCILQGRNKERKEKKERR
jgi:hypothetical protein